MSAHRPSQAELCDALLATWSRIVPLSPSEAASRREELLRLLALEAGRLPAPIQVPSPEADRLLAVASRLTQAGLLELGAANLWPDTPGRLFSGLLADGVRPALAGLAGLATPDRLAAALEALQPVAQVHLAEAQAQGQGSLDRDQVQGQVAAILGFAAGAWPRAAACGPEAYPALLGASGALVAALLSQDQRTPGSGDQVLWALAAVLDAVAECARPFLESGGSTADLEDRLARAVDAVTADLAAPGHPPLDRNEVAARFQRAW